MTPADHANTVRHALENDGPHRTVASRENALAALDALQTQAERNLVTEALARNAQVHIDGALKDRQRAEAAEAERDRARAALRRILDMGDYVYKPHEFADIARAALGDKPAP